MKTNKTAVSAALCLALGCTASFTAQAGAVTIPNGNYKILITSYKATPNVGSDGAWNSTFTFGCTPGNTGCGSQMMTDNGTNVVYASGPAAGTAFGSGVGGDKVAGTIDITVTNSGGKANFTATSFNVDMIKSTAGGNFVQYVDPNIRPNAMTGSIDTTSGAMTFTPTGRLGAVQGYDTLYNNLWNVYEPDNPTNYIQFTTGTVSNVAAGNSSKKNPTGTITGHPVTPTSPVDLNGDGLPDFSAILVTTGKVGSTWGGFFGNPYFETWNVTIMSSVVASAKADGPVQTPVDTPVTIAVLANDTGALPLHITATTNGTHGTVAVNQGTPDTVTYTPASGYTGSDTFTYTLTDNNVATSVGTVTVSVTAAAVPIANHDTASTTQNQPVTINVLANDTDAQDAGGKPGGAVTIASIPAKGTAVVNTDRTVTYTPFDGFVGTDTFTYTATDLDGNTSAPATVTVDVSASALTSSGTYGPGATAVKESSADGHLNTGQLISAGIPADNVPKQGVNTMCVGDCFDFTVTGVIGTTVNVVLPPLSTPIPSADARYRKYHNGAWTDFDTSTGDLISSAPLTTGTAGGGCPNPTDASWKIWTGATAGASHVGDACLRLTIADGGPNDAAGSTAGTVNDPGGLGTGISPPTSDPVGVLNGFNTSSGGGCSLSTAPVNPSQRADWWLLGAFTAWLGGLKLRKHAAK